ncbi:DUF4272 domain-containing protein [Microscilla marina]|uniref:DUF4272 domain-containing protein n=1 Tax=Microscilla marina ATCC 23134 TaxID=313606 RepID=A1ZZD1_MICM2|nr:DUF4272 domain-containing protein [Microscilla marina]EAY24230.1 conserved hypothetical protein [Microscilla marina ATCC 23134]
MVNVAVRKGLLGTEKKFQLSYRERAKPSYQISELDSPLTQNLAGMLNFVGDLQSTNEEVKGLLMAKIKTLNFECAVLCSPLVRTMLTGFIEQVIQQLDAIVFAQAKVIIGKSKVQQFLDKNLDLILDLNGKCGIDDLSVHINSQYFDAPPENANEAQLARKVGSEKILKAHEVKVNVQLPVIVAEDEVKLRAPHEVAERVTVLAITTSVAFGGLSGEGALNYLAQYKLQEALTPRERAFLQNPTEELKSQETWKCEGIWTLMWALGVVDELSFPDTLANLNDIPVEQYPIGENKNPRDFIESMTTLRDKSEVLNTNDLYYRMHWACVDARIARQAMKAVHPGVVYERHYALNWLINYRNQPWDEVTCDT